MVSNGNSVTRYKTFHPLGWITSSTQRTSGADFDFSYTYDLAGGLASVSYPSGKTVNYCADSAGRMTKATRDNCVIAQANLFWPSGLIRSLQYANGVRFGNRAVTSGSTAVPGTTGMTPVVADVDCAVASSINNATVAGLFPGNRWTAGAPPWAGGSAEVSGRIPGEATDRRLPSL